MRSAGSIARRRRSLPLRQIGDPDIAASLEKISES